MIDPDKLFNLLSSDDPASALVERLEEERIQATRIILMADYSSMFGLYAFVISTLEYSDGFVEGMLGALPETIVDRRLLAEPNINDDENTDCKAMLESEAESLGSDYKAAVLKMRKKLLSMGDAES